MIKKHTREIVVSCLGVGVGIVATFAGMYVTLYGQNKEIAIKQEVSLDNQEEIRADIKAVKDQTNQICARQEGVLAAIHGNEKMWKDYKKAMEHKLEMQRKQMFDMQIIEKEIIKSEAEHEVDDVIKFWAAAMGSMKNGDLKEAYTGPPAPIVINVPILPHKEQPDPEWKGLVGQ